MRSVLLGLISAFAVASSAAAAPPARVGRIDRMKVVGAPVLDENAKRGVYVWIEDGAFQLAVVDRAASGKQQPVKYRVAIDSTSAIDTKGAGDFRASAGGRGVVLEVTGGAAVARGSVSTEGDVTISLSEPKGSASTIFLGPLARPGASSVVIGRF